MLIVKQLETAEVFSDLEGEWNQLLEQSLVDDAFLTWEWLSSWWKHFGHRYQLRLLTARENGELLGIAPLMLEQKRVLGVKLRVLRNIGVPPPDVGGFIIRKDKPHVLMAFGEHLVREARWWDILSLREIPASLLDVRSFIACFPDSSFTSRMDTTRHFYIQIGGNWETYFENLSKNLRNDLRKKIRRIEKQYELSYCRFVGRKATQAHMRALFELNEHCRLPHMYQSKTEQTFHLDLAQNMSEQGWLDLSFLYLEGKPIAYRYGFLYRGCFEDWRTGFNTQYFPLSVGKVLLMFLVKDCFERKVRELHFLRGDEDYKERWQVIEREFVHPFVVRKRPMAMITYLWIPQAKRLVRQSVGRSERLVPLLDRYDKWRDNRKISL